MSDELVIGGDLAFITIILFAGLAAYGAQNIVYFIKKKLRGNDEE